MRARSRTQLNQAKLTYSGVLFASPRTAPPELGIERPRPVKIAYKNLTFAAGKPVKRDILHNMTGTFGPAELVAIMGPSGAGKTTLLSLLTGQIQHFDTGTIELNNKVTKEAA